MAACAVQPAQCAGPHAGHRHHFSTPQRGLPQICFALPGFVRAGVSLTRHHWVSRLSLRVAGGLYPGDRRSPAGVPQRYFHQRRPGLYSRSPLFCGGADRLCRLPVRPERECGVFEPHVSGTFGGDGHRVRFAAGRFFTVPLHKPVARYWEVLERSSVVYINIFIAIFTAKPCWRATCTIRWIRWFSISLSTSWPRAPAF